MKPKNFPARKLARQIAADLRLNGRADAKASEILFYDLGRGGALDTARALRTKKNRGRA